MTWQTTVFNNNNYCNCTKVAHINDTSVMEYSGLLLAICGMYGCVQYGQTQPLGLNTEGHIMCCFYSWLDEIWTDPTADLYLPKK